MKSCIMRTAPAAAGKSPRPKYELAFLNPFFSSLNSFPFPLFFFIFVCVFFKVTSSGALTRRAEYCEMPPVKGFLRMEGRPASKDPCSLLRQHCTINRRNGCCDERAWNGGKSELLLLLLSIICMNIIISIIENHAPVPIAKWVLIV